MTRPYNFAPGPATIPEEVLRIAQAEMLDWRGLGISVMELSHRTEIFPQFLLDLENKLRKLMNIPNNYKVLFLPGGAQGQFAAIPMNLTKNNREADYFATGIWSDRAVGYAKKYCNVNLVTQATKAGNGVKAAIPDKATWRLNPDAAYAYYCPNETVNGIMFKEVPQVGSVPLVADWTSSIASTVIDVNDFAVIFASAQKNLGQAGVTLVIVRDDLTELEQDITPPLWSYRLQAQEKSCVNTPPVYAIYIMDLMVDWLERQGGVSAIEAINRRKAQKLYACIDNSNGFYTNPVDKDYRSLINVPFDLPNKELLNKFFIAAKDAGLEYLTGHFLVGGARASLYNAMPEAGVDVLVSFMQSFATQHG